MCVRRNQLDAGAKHRRPACPPCHAEIGTGLTGAGPGGRTVFLGPRAREAATSRPDSPDRSGGTLFGLPGAPGLSDKEAGSAQEKARLWTGPRGEAAREVCASAQGRKEGTVPIGVVYHGRITGPQRDFIDQLIEEHSARSLAVVEVEVSRSPGSLPGTAYHVTAAKKWILCPDAYAPKRNAVRRPPFLEMDVRKEIESRLKERRAELGRLDRTFSSLTLSGPGSGPTRQANEAVDS